MLFGAADLVGNGAEAHQVTRREDEPRDLNDMVGIGYAVLLDKLDKRQDLLVKLELVVPEPIHNRLLTIDSAERVEEDGQHSLLHDLLQHCEHPGDLLEKFATLREQG